MLYSVHTQMENCQERERILIPLLFPWFKKKEKKTRYSEPLLSFAFLRSSGGRSKWRLSSNPLTRHLTVVLSEHGEGFPDPVPAPGQGKMWYEVTQRGNSRSNLGRLQVLADVFEIVASGHRWAQPSNCSSVCLGILSRVAACESQPDWADWKMMWRRRGEHWSWRL